MALALSPNAQAELLPVLKHALTGVIAGRQVDDSVMTGVVMIHTPIPGSDDYDVCTGTMIRGCLLTAAHCVNKTQRQQILIGAVPNGKQPATFIADFRKIGDKTHTDIAVARLNAPLNESVYYEPSVLARERIDEKTATAQGLAILGYGARATVEGKDGVPYDIGFGKKRRGSVKFDGYASVEPNARTGYQKGAGKTEQAIFLRRGPSIGGRGDSGGPLIMNNRIFGVSSAVSGPMLESNSGEPARAKIPYADEVDQAIYASVADNYDAIQAAMKELNCLDDTEENLLAALRTDFKTALGGKDWKANWQSADASLKARIRENLRRLTDQEPGTLPEVTLLDYQAGKIRFTVQPKNAAPSAPLALDL